MTDMRRIVSENRRIVSVIAGAIVLNVVLLALVVYPLSQKEQGGEAEAQAASRALAAARADFNNAKATVSGKSEADAELRKFYSDVLPADHSSARSLLYPHLDQLAASTNLKTGVSRMLPAQDRNSQNLRKLTLNMNVSGEYTNIRRFVHELETAQEFLVLESVALSQGEGEEQGLKLTAVVATYFRPGNGN